MRRYQKPDPTSPYLDTLELATLLRTTPAGVRAMHYRGQIPEEACIQRCKYGRRLYRRDVITKWIEGGLR